MKIKIFGWIVSSIGIGLLIFVDWRIALGVSLYLWGDNIDKNRFTP